MRKSNFYKIKNYIKYIVKKSYRDELDRIQRESTIEKLNDIQGKAKEDILILRRLNKKVGTFSDYIVFLKSIEYAIETGKLPIIDRMTIKNDFMPAPENINTWELFFEQPKGYGLDDIDYTSMTHICYVQGSPFFMKGIKVFQVFPFRDTVVVILFL